MSSNTMTLPSPLAWPQAPSPGPVLYINSTSNGAALSASTSQSAMIAALPAAIIIVMLAIVLALSYAKTPPWLPHLAQQPAAAAQPEKAEAPLQPLFREMPVVLLQPNQKILIGKQVPAAPSQHLSPSADQDIYIVVIQP